jgi:hypothetical protein
VELELNQIQQILVSRVYAGKLIFRKEYRVNLLLIFVKDAKDIYNHQAMTHRLVTEYDSYNMIHYESFKASWIKAELESRDLLTLLIKKLKGTLTQVRLIDASFIWTEPHSKRIKIKLKIQKEIQEGAILEQTVPIEFVVQGAQCTDCQRVEAKNYWKSVVQVRQQVKHKRTFLYVEQVILKHGMFENTLRIGETQHGLDFFYGRPQVISMTHL